MLSPLKLLLNEVAVLGSFPLKFLFPFLPSWSRSKWWSTFLRHAFHSLYCASRPSTLADHITGVRSTSVQRCSSVMTPSVVSLSENLPPWVVRAFPSII